MTASAIATTFFLISSGFVLIIMGTANLPKMYSDDSKSHKNNTQDMTS